MTKELLAENLWIAMETFNARRTEAGPIFCLPVVCAIYAESMDEAINIYNSRYVECIESAIPETKRDFRIIKVNKCYSKDDIDIVPVIGALQYKKA